MKNLFHLMVVFAVLSIVGCRGSSGNSDDAGITDAGEPDGSGYVVPADLNQLSHPWALITVPTGRRTYTTIESSIDIGGPGFADEVTWTTDRGSSGTSPAVGHWAATVGLEMGDNVINIVTDASGISDTLTVTRNAHVAFAGPVEYFPKAVPINDASSVTFRVSIPFSDDVFISDLVVARLDDNLQITDELCHLLDDGNVATGDRAPGDLEYACVHSFNEPVDGVIKLRVVVDNIGPNGAETAMSEVFTLRVVTPITQLEVDRMDAVFDGVWTAHNQALPQGVVAAADAMLAWLQSQTDVDGAGRSEDGHTVWWQLLISGGRRLTMGFGGGPPGTFGGIHVQPTKGLILEPFYDEWFAENAQISEDVEDRLNQARCPRIDPVHVHHEPLSNPGVDEFKKMGNYGVVFIYSHGTEYEARIQVAGGERRIKRSVILTQQEVGPWDVTTAAGLPGRYFVDVIPDPSQPYAPAPLIRWMNNGKTYWTITSAFFDEHVSFDRAIVFSGSCDGLNDIQQPDATARAHSLSARMLKAGADVLVAFNDGVEFQFGANWTKQYAKELVDGYPAGPAFERVAEDLGLLCPNSECEADILTNQPEDWLLELCWACDGYWRRHDVYSSSGYSYNGLLEVQHRIRPAEAGSFEALEMRAQCRVSMSSEMEVAPGMFHYFNYVAVGSYEQAFVDDFPSVFTIESDKSAVTFWSGAFPDDSTWVYRTDTSSLAPAESSLVDCEVLHEVYETYGTAGAYVTITSDAIMGNLHETTSGGGSLDTQFEYRLQP